MYRPRPRRRVGRRLLVTLLVLVVLAAVAYLYLDSKLNREDALADYPGRVADTPGTNWLIVGSDSREGLSRDDRAELKTGNAAGRRTDTMMLLHIPAGEGTTTLVSLPRDSFVPIPGRGDNKLNAAYAFGGPRLLVRTVEGATGVRIDHYAEIGLGGFASMVDAVGGVEICVKRRMRDPKAGLDLEAGCQELDGKQALGYVRTRNYARADLERVEHQREFMSALVKKATSPAVLLNPVRIVPLATGAADSFIVADGDHLHHLVGLAFGMRDITGGSGVTTTVPIGGSSSSPAVGSYIQWDSAKASALFDALAEDRPVPRSVLRK